MRSLFIRQETEYPYKGTVRIFGYRQEPKPGALYHKMNDLGGETKTEIILIPYYAWANRGVNEMRVWMRRKDSAKPFDIPN